MSLYKQYKTEEKVEKEGFDLNLGKNSKGEPVKIRLARAGGSNMKFAKALERRTKAYRRQIQNETLPEDVGQEIQREVYADAVILGWSGVEDEKDQPLPFTRENVIKLLTDLPDLFTEIREASNKASLYRAEVREEDGKN